MLKRTTTFNKMKFPSVKKKPMPKTEKRKCENDTSLLHKKYKDIDDKIEKLPDNHPLKKKKKSMQNAFEEMSENFAESNSTDDDDDVDDDTDLIYDETQDRDMACIDQVHDLSVYDENYYMDEYDDETGAVQKVSTEDLDGDLKRLKDVLPVQVFSILKKLYNTENSINVLLKNICVKQNSIGRHDQKKLKDVKKKLFDFFLPDNRVVYNENFDKKKLKTLFMTLSEKNNNKKKYYYSVNLSFVEDFTTQKAYVLLISALFSSEIGYKNGNIGLIKTDSPTVFKMLTESVDNPDSYLNLVIKKNCFMFLCN